MNPNQKPLVTNAADESQVKGAAAKVDRRRLQELMDLSAVLEMPEGRRVFWKLLNRCGVFKISARDSGSWTYFQEGMRNIGLEILADVNELNPDIYSTMAKEAKQKGEQ